MNIMKVTIAYPPRGEGNAEELVTIIRRNYPDAIIKRTGEKDGYYHIYVSIKERLD